MRIIHRHTNPVVAAVSQAVKTARHRERSVSGQLLASMHSSGGICTTTLQGSTTLKKWLLGDSLGTFRF